MSKLPVTNDLLCERNIDLKYLRLKVCSNAYLGGHTFKICKVDCVHKTIQQVSLNINFQRSRV